MIKIFTDAAANLFKKYLTKHNLDIKILPMKACVGEKEYNCYDDGIDAEELSEEMYKLMEEGRIVKTSLVSPGIMKKEFTKEVEQGNQVLYISLASGVSGSYQSACMISEMINEEKNEEVVKVIDSKTASFGEGMIAIFAYKKVLEGKSFIEVYEETLKYVDTVRSEFTVGNIKYISNTGRVSAVAKALAKILSIKIMLYGSNEAKIEVSGKIRGRVNALNQLALQANEYAVDKTRKVYICHCICEEDANTLKSKLEEQGFTDVEILIYDLITGCHAGPGTIAIFYEGLDRSFEKKGPAKVISNIIDKIKK